MSRARFCYPLAAGVWLLAGACWPGAATPMPQPPTFDLGGVGQPEVAKVLGGDFVTIHGAAGAVPARATVRITNLDRSTDVAAVDAADNGLFDVDVAVSDGDELRFEWAKGAQRSQPADAFFRQPGGALTGFTLEPSPRFDCLELTPGLVLDFTQDGEQVLTLHNECADDLAFDNARSRLALPDFALLTAVPFTLPAGQSTELRVSFARNAPGFREDVLLVDITLGGTLIRYPITLRAE